MGHWHHTGLSSVYGLAIGLLLCTLYKKQPPNFESSFHQDCLFLPTGCCSATGRAWVTRRFWVKTTKPHSMKPWNIVLQLETNFIPTLMYDSLYWDPFHWHFTLIMAWISNCIDYNVWDKIIFPFLNFNVCTVEFWEWISNFTIHFIVHMFIYPCWE